MRGRPCGADWHPCPSCSFVGNVDGITPLTRHAGVFYPKKGPNGKLLGCMVLEAVAVFLWGVVMATPLFAALQTAKKLQVRILRLDRRVAIDLTLGGACVMQVKPLEFRSVDGLKHFKVLADPEGPSEEAYVQNPAYVA